MSEAKTLTPIAQALFSNLIDYAGLFPPAKLSLEETIENYLRYRTSARSWILGSLILQTSHLNEVAARKSESDLSGFSPEPLSVILVTKNPRVDLEKALELLDGKRDKLVLKGVEIGLDSNQAISKQLRELQSFLEILYMNFKGVKVFLELPMDSTDPSSLTDLFRFMEHSSIRSMGLVGIKLRCGGLEHGAPSAAVLGKVLSECALHDVPLKFTAGLHHPFPVVGVPDAAHGFFNLFFAGFVAYAFRPTENTLTSILNASAKSGPAPQMTDHECSWLGFLLSASKITELRAQRVTSFGSCSFIEPTEEAVTLGWLPPSQNP